VGGDETKRGRRWKKKTGEKKTKKLRRKRITETGEEKFREREGRKVRIEMGIEGNSNGNTRTTKKIRGNL
jgi:hypothetical protein